MTGKIVGWPSSFSSRDGKSDERKSERSFASQANTSFPWPDCKDAQVPPDATIDNWEELLQGISPAGTLPSTDGFSRAVSQELGRCYFAPHEGSRRSAARRLLNLFRAMVGIALMRNGPVAELLSEFEALAQTIYEAGDFESWSEVSLRSIPSKRDCAEVLRWVAWLEKGAV